MAPKGASSSAKKKAPRKPLVPLIPSDPEDEPSEEEPSEMKRSPLNFVGRRQILRSTKIFLVI